MLFFNELKIKIQDLDVVFLIWKVVNVFSLIIFKIKTCLYGCLVVNTRSVQISDA